MDGSGEGWMGATERRVFWEMELSGGIGEHKVIAGGGGVSVGQHLTMGAVAWVGG